MVAKTKGISAAHGAMRWHRPVGWVGGIALLVLGLSGLTHPLMTWFGPQQAVFAPPRATFTAAEVSAIPEVLAHNHIDSAQGVRVIATAEGNLLQVSDGDGVLRRYFSLEDGREYPELDAGQAKWLARHYTGLTDTPIRSVQLHTRFDAAYPAVNRLLPVWRVAFDTDDNLSAFVHTELNALATLSNDTRVLQQTLFRALHTWTWLERWEPLRVAALLVLSLGLLAMCLTGLVMTLALPGRRIPDPRRRWHRALALGLWVPLLAFTASGLYHLLYHAGDRESPGTAYGVPLSLAGGLAAPVFDAAGAPGPQQGFSAISLVAGEAGGILYRLVSNGQEGPRAANMAADHHHGRFEGRSGARAVWLLDGSSGLAVEANDEQLARAAAARHLGIAAPRLGASALVTRYGPDYDFRNRRLPVWRVAHDQGTLFIDPASGVLVDRASGADRVEGFTFSHLHKWNFLTPLTGRQARDGLVVLVILLATVFASLGFAMLLRQRRRPLKTEN